MAWELHGFPVKFDVHGIQLMSPQEIAAPGVVSLDDLKSLAAEKGPCITVVAPIPSPAGIRTRLKNAIRGIEKKLEDQGTNPGKISSLIEPVQALLDGADTQKKWANSLIVFRSAKMFRYYWLQDLCKEILAVADGFQIRPLLSLQSREQRFYVLALSRQRTRLVRCTQHGAEEVEGLEPQNMRAWLNTRQPDHVLESRSYAGPSVGSMKGVTSGTSADRDSGNEYLAHFLKEIEKSVHSLLRDESAPLLLAGVEYELALYRKANTYQRLSEKAIHGATDHLAPRELRQQALDTAMQLFSEPLQKALADFEKQQNNGRVSLDVREILRAAHAGRVADLLVSDAAERRGLWNDERHQIEIPANEDDAEDLLNVAALQTLTHSGRAFALQPQDMPQQAEAAAVFRF
jgi:hypothetical protein